MRQINNMGWAFLFLLVASLVSCDKADTEGMSGVYDTDIPEGYMKVIFPAEKLETRAVNGRDNRISHLRYLVYQATTTNEYTLLDNKVLFSNSQGTNVEWPYSDLTLYLPKDADYKVVFLGNVDKSLFGNSETNDLLTGIETGAKYEDARIVAPAAGFDEKKQNLYYWANCSFDTRTPSENGTMTVNNAVMQRIVSRCRLSSYGIESTQDVGTGTDYNSCFYYSLLNDDNLLGDKVFGSTGAMGYWFMEMLEDDIIYPVAYMLNKAGTLTANATVSKWFEDLGGTDYVIGKDEATSKKIKDLLDIFAENGDMSTFYKSPEHAKKFGEFLNELLNGTYLDAMIRSIKEGNIINISVSSPSYTYAKRETASMLETAQTGNEEGKILATWNSFAMGSMVVTFDCKNVPTQLDLDLTVKGTTETFSETQVISLSDSYVDKTEGVYRDDVLNLYFLGDNQEGDGGRWGISSLKIQGGSGEIEAAIPKDLTSITGTLSRNKSLDYRTVPKNLSLGDNYLQEKDPLKICFVYGKLIAAIKEDVSSLEEQDIKNLFIDALNAKYGKTGTGGGANSNVDLDADNGELTGEHGVQSGFDFYIPDFSSSNLTGTLEWEKIQE